MAEEDCADLESTLAALPLFARGRARIMLEGVRIQADENAPAMAFAANYILTLAQEIWEVMPPAPPLPARRAAVGHGIKPRASYGPRAVTSV
jgi:hypothetical protein